MAYIAWNNGRWLPLDEICWPLNHPAARYGAVVVDRLRTVAGSPLDVEQHVARFSDGCERVGTGPVDSQRFVGLVQQCVSRNRASFGRTDFSIVLLALPGVSDLSEPWFAIHPSPIDHNRLYRWYENGQPLDVAGFTSVPPGCWPADLKHRSRLNYFLADQQAWKRLGHEAGAVLVDADGCLTETSVANVFIVEGHRLVSPPAESILPGISLQRTRRLAQQLGLTWIEEPITPERARLADSLLLCGSVGCLWWACRLGDTLLPPAPQNQVYRALKQAWCEDISGDFQAISEQVVRTAETSR